MAQKDLGILISELRKKANMTQQDLADRIHITDKAISKWERGLASPDVETFPKLAELFGVSSEELLNAKLKKEDTKRIMYEYEYVNIELEKHGIIRRVESTHHQEIINKYAKNGYRHVGFMPTKIDESGIIIEMDLIFEKTIQTADG